MKLWTKILPFFLIEILAKKQCQIYTARGYCFVSPYPGIRIIMSIDEIDRRDNDGQ